MKARLTRLTYSLATLAALAAALGAGYKWRWPYSRGVLRWRLVWLAWPTASLPWPPWPPRWAPAPSGADRLPPVVRSSAMKARLTRLAYSLAALAALAAALGAGNRWH